MNENQHDASVALSRARARFHIAREEMAKSRRELHDAIVTLQEAIRRDPDSWEGTPGIDKYEDQLADGE